MSQEKPQITDVLAMIACVVIAIVSIFSAIYGDMHTCCYCGKKIFKTEEAYVVSDGYMYYHTGCYMKKFKEESENETD